MKKVSITRILGVVAILTMSIVSCKKDKNIDDDDIKTVETPTEVKGNTDAEKYFANTLVSVIKSNCVNCHSGYHGHDDSSNFSTYTRAASRASDMYNLVKSGSMPIDAAKLAQKDIDKFKKFNDFITGN